MDITFELLSVLYLFALTDMHFCLRHCFVFVGVDRQFGSSASKTPSSPSISSLSLSHLISSSHALLGSTHSSHLFGLFLPSCPTHAHTCLFLFHLLSSPPPPPTHLFLCGRQKKRTREAVESGGVGEWGRQGRLEGVVGVVGVG